MRIFYLIIVHVILYSLTVAESLVEVRAVYINCEADDREDMSADNDVTRFEREELFKHSVLQDCNKKIALTVKITSEPKQNSGDEYIPIEHVFYGPNKRVRLLNPYVLRLRREMPVQAYRLRRMANVIGAISNSDSQQLRKYEDIGQNNRPKRSPKRDVASKSTENAKNCEFINKYSTNSNVYLNNREKRHIRNIIVEDAMNDAKYGSSNARGNLIEEYDRNKDSQRDLYDTFHEITRENEKNKFILKPDDNSNGQRPSGSWSFYPNDEKMIARNTDSNSIDSKPDTTFDVKRDKNNEHRTQENFEFKKHDSSEDEFEMYEIGNPDLFYTVQVQLFEKLTTPEGTTVWNDITKGEPASVNSMSPEWMGQELNIRYQPSDWIPREEFTLPLTSLCLLSPLSNLNFKPLEDINFRSNDDVYIVVPKEDILGLKSEDGIVLKREGNYSNILSSTAQDEQCHRRVKIRTSRALFGSKQDSLNIIMNLGEQFLTMPHHRPHHAQIDLEARADENQLVPVGSSGRIMTVVADSSRRTRTTLTIQVTNTGLAAATFRAIARDCGPGSMVFQNDNNGEALSGSPPILLAPRHTRSLRLDVPSEMSADTTHCVVSLQNDEDKTVAVRDVTIKKGDRCFCVWHCECVCLTDDPKLLCRDMTESRQIAAGLSLRERVRHTRSICYQDVASINMIFTAFGVLITLLFFGLIKGSLGIVCRYVGTWGLHRILEMPRKLENYYEDSLRDCPVIYDDEGWPIHPKTKERTVQLISKPMEFLLNLVFFVTLPCLIIYDVLKGVCTRCKPPEEATVQTSNKENHCYNSNDIQAKKRRGRRRRRIRRWMTPTAEEISTNIWQDGMIPVKSVVDYMRPLLRQDLCCGEKLNTKAAGMISEGDDTEYVLMQMQKSKESLARSQRMLNGSED